MYRIPTSVKNYDLFISLLNRKTQYIISMSNSYASTENSWVLDCSKISNLWRLQNTFGQLKPNAEPHRVLLLWYLIYSIISVKLLLINSNFKSHAIVHYGPSQFFIAVQQPPVDVPNANAPLPDGTYYYCNLTLHTISVRLRIQLFRYIKSYKTWRIVSVRPLLVCVCVWENCVRNSIDGEWNW